MNAEIRNIIEAIESIHVDATKKLILRGRFLQLIQKYSSNKYYYIVFYDIGRLIVTIGSISIPALLSTENYMNRTISFWVIWSISLLVSLVNGYITLFKLDKKYFSNITIIEKLACEFWQYVSLCGKYSGSYGHIIPTHENQFIFFANNIERMQIKNIEEIYIKLLDTAASKQQEEVIAIPSISEESYKKSSELKDSIQEKSKITPLKNIIVS
jgi:hypothetical protein